MTTIKDIAKAAGVTPSTVSRVIADHDRISAGTKQKVRRIMEELGYHPNMTAKSLVSKVTNTIVVLLPRPAEELFQDIFFGELLRGILASASKSGYDTMLAAAAPSHSELETVSRLVMGGRVDGVLLLSSRMNDPVVAFLDTRQFPSVLIGSAEDTQHMWTVDNDNVQAAYDAVNHLIKQGHERIGFVSGPQQLIVSQHRLQGYKKALKEAGLQIRPEWIIDGELLQQSGYRAMSYLMDMAERPTGLAVIDDVVTFGVLRGLHELGYAIPQDMSVVSFNNILLAEVASPPISSVDIGTYQLGYTAAQMLIQQIHGVTSQRNRTIIPHRLIVRESSIYTIMQRSWQHVRQ